MNHHSKPLSLEDRLQALQTRLSNRRDRRGMTLIELMIVVALIVLVTGVLAAGVVNLSNGAKVDATALSINKAAQQVNLYKVRKGKLPSSSEGLGKVYVYEDVPKDAWQNDLVYVVPGANGQDFDIVSYGADGKEGGDGIDADIRLSDQ